MCFEPSFEAGESKERFFNRVDLKVRREPREHPRDARAHIAIKRIIARPHHDARSAETRPAEMPGRTHFDPECFRFVRARDYRAIVV
jgi:hypothetical protein